MIKTLELYNFRLYNYRKFDLNKGINIIVGGNASGKSTLVEAVYVLGTCKSFRTHYDTEILRFNQQFYSVVSTTDQGNISISYCDGEKKINVNDSNVKTMSKYIGTVNVVLFSPEDLNIIKGDPKTRRKFLDVCISQIDKEYLDNLIEYNRILKERNELLKKIDYKGLILGKNDDLLLELYSKVLSEKAITIIRKRNDFLSNLNVIVKEKLKEIVSNEIVEITYKPFVNDDEIENKFFETKTLDLYTKRTNIGSHKDDFEICLNSKKAASYASQGQQRTIAIAIKLAYAEILKRLNKECVVILDDVYGELDPERQKNIIKMLDLNNQILITTTTLSCIEKDIIDKSKIIKI